MNRSTIIYYIKLLVALVAWSSLYHMVKPLMLLSDPYIIAFVRYTIATVILLFFLKLKTGSFKPGLNFIQWSIVISIGLVGICLYNVLFFNAEALIPGNTVAIFYAFVPVLTTVLNSCIFKVRLNSLSKIGIIISLIGAIGTVNYATPQCRSFFCKDILNQIGIGEIYSILAVFSFSFYLILSKYANLKKIPALTLNTYASIIGCAVLGFLTTVKSNFNQVLYFTWDIWLIIIYISVFATAVAYLWYTSAIFHLGVVRATIFQNTIPVQAVLIGYLFYGQSISIGEITCGIIVLFGVYMTNYACSLPNGQVKL